MWACETLRVIFFANCEIVSKREKCAEGLDLGQDNKAIRNRFPYLPIRKLKVDHWNHIIIFIFKDRENCLSRALVASCDS